MSDDLQKHIITRGIAKPEDYVTEPPERRDEAFTDESGTSDAANHIDLAAIFRRTP
jgi:hypothetical protein